MPFMQLTLLYSLLMFFAGDQAKETEAINIILQSKDGGQTWQDISRGLPETERPVGLSAGASEIYLSTEDVTYRSKTNLKTPVWEKVNGIDPQSRLDFNQSGVLAYSYDGHIYQKKASSETWLPIYTSLISTKLKPHSVATIFQASDGAVFLSTGKSLSKSVDKGQSWKLIQKTHVGVIVESDGVLLASGQKGIMRSTDHGEHWDWVLSEGGGVGAAIERIDGGFAAIVYDTRIKSRRIFTSMDNGKTWRAIDNGLPPSPNISSVKQIGSNLFVGHPEGIFRSSDKGKTWHRVHAGLGGSNVLQAVKFSSLNAAPVKKEKVFILHVSGTVLYAVASTPGC